MSDLDSLDEIADRLSALPVRMQGSLMPTIVRVGRRFDRWPYAVAVTASLPSFGGMLIRSFRVARTLPDPDETSRLYRAVLGVDRDRARADIAAVEDRLQWLTAESVIRDAARWLVHWVASSRPSSGPNHEAVEARYRELINSRNLRADAKVGKHRDRWRDAYRVAEVTARMGEDYEAAWRRLLYGLPAGERG